MAVTLNASTSSGLAMTADGSGIMKVQSNGVTTNALAWVRFDGTVASPTAAAAYNVTSITKNGTGDYTVNLTNALADANYSVCGLVGRSTGAFACFMTVGGAATSTTAVRLQIFSYAAAATDSPYTMVAIFGN